jgi:hypothetical protein
MDEKEEDKSEESLRKHVLFYEKLNQKIFDIQEEIKITSDEKTLKHLNERIDALELDKKRIRKLFPQKSDETWNHPN